MRCEIWSVVVISAVLGTACEDKKPVEPATPQTVATASTTSVTASQTTAGAAQPAEDNFGSFADADWCPRAHDDTVKIVEGMKQTMKLAGKEAEDDDEFAPPERARYLELCGKLPLEMQKCLVVGWAARNREACQASLDGLDADAKAAYGELMGK